MKSISPLLPLLTLAGLECAAALGVGEKFQLAPGGKSFDRFITVWLENQVRVLPVPLQEAFPLAINRTTDILTMPTLSRTSSKSSKTPISPT